MNLHMIGSQAEAPSVEEFLESYSFVGKHNGFRRARLL
jgi:hypothetical protein